MIWRSSHHSRIAQLADFSIVVLSIIFSYYVSNILHAIIPGVFPAKFAITDRHLIYSVIVSFLFIILYENQKAYSYQRFTSLLREYSIIFKVNIAGVLISIALAFLGGLNEMPRTIFGVFFIISLVLFTAEKTFLFYIAATIRKKGKDRKRVILIGTGTRTKAFIDVVQGNFQWGLDIVGLLTGDDNSIGSVVKSVRVIDHYRNIRKVLKEINPEEIIITISTKRFDQIRDVLEVCEEEGVLVRLNSDFFGHITKNVTTDQIFGLNIISFNMVHQSEIDLFLKRALDISGSLVALVLFSPFMIIAAAGIYFSDGGPVIYEWNVVGRNKKPFKSWKFRTMVKNADQLKKDLMEQNEMDGPVFKIKNDPRILPFGRWLRKWSIDETLQLFSVIKGDMSLVGPRPAGPHELIHYEGWQRRKLSIKPGITCLWQAGGRNKISNFDDWVRLDLEYIDNWSLLLDIKILLKTIPSVIFSKGAS